MKEAMEQVKLELGVDAVILHTKKYREGGILGIHAREVVEVTAAIEDEDEKRQKSRQEKTAAQGAVSATSTTSPTSGGHLDIVSPAGSPIIPPPSVLGQYKTNGTETGVRLASGEMPIAPPAFPQPSVSAAPTGVDFGLARAGQVAPGYATAPVTPPQQAAPAMPAAPNTAPPLEENTYFEEEPMTVTETSSPEDREKIKKLEDELTQMKTLLAQVMSKDQPVDKVTMQEALHRQEVDDAIIADLAGAVPAGDTMLDCLDDRARESLAGYLGEVMNFSEGIKLNKHGVRIVALIGATGVGKTTTLAKIAARFVLENNIRAALITADTYRISAVEQLKTYSDIIGLPLEIVYSPDELKVAIHKHRDKDLILIDTAGRSQHNEYQMQELQEFLAAAPHIEKHLVMSATTKNRDAADILEKFSVCDPDRVIFTKTDETSSVGLILNCLKDKKIALSFLTNGQSVPDDIVPATPEKLAALLLRE